MMRVASVGDPLLYAIARDECIESVSEMYSKDIAALQKASAQVVACACTHWAADAGCWHPIFQ